MQKQNIITIGAATTPDEAQALQDSNMDLIVATGSDAGGHRPSFLKPAEESLIGTFSLIPLIVDIVDKPIIAAGGIGDGRGIVAAFALGAEGVQIGTRFLACHESGASETHKVQLTLPSARYTALTRVFSGRYARGIPNRFMNEMKAYEADLPPYPIQNWFTQSIRRAAGLAGHSEYLSLWAGQTASLSCRQPAAESFAELVRQVEETLDRSFLH